MAALPQNNEGGQAHVGGGESVAAESAVVGPERIHYVDHPFVHTKGVVRLFREATGQMRPQEPVSEATCHQGAAVAGGAGTSCGATSFFPHHERCPQRVVRGLNISKKYAAGIEGFEGCRELVQNWIDQCERLCLSRSAQAGAAALLELEPRIFYGRTLPGKEGGHVRERLVTLSSTLHGVTTCHGYLLEWEGGCDGPEAAGGLNHRYVQLTNLGTVLREDSLLLGHSTGKEHRGAAGGFGEGMKVEINRLVGRGVSVKYVHGRYLWEFAHNGGGGDANGHERRDRDAVELLFSSTRLDEFHGHLSILLDAPAPNDRLVQKWNSIQARPLLNFVDLCMYLKLSDSYVRPPPGAVLACTGSEVELLLDERYHGKIFVSGIFVTDRVGKRNTDGGAVTTMLTADKDATLHGIGINYVGKRETYGGKDGIEFGRDRGSINLTRALRDFSFVLHHHLCCKGLENTPLIQKLCQVVESNLRDVNSAIAGHFRIALVDCFERWVKQKETDDGLTHAAARKTIMGWRINGWKCNFHDFHDIASKLMDQFVMASATSAGADQQLVYPCSEESVEHNEEEARQARYIGATRVPVSKDFLTLLRFADNCPTMDRLWARAADQVSTFPDWIPTSDDEREFASRLVKFAGDQFGKYAPKGTLLFKRWPSGTTSNCIAVVPIPSSKCFVIDPALLSDNAKVHAWMKSQGEACWTDGSASGSKCNGACMNFQFKESLKQAILKLDGSVTHRDLDREQARQACCAVGNRSQKQKSAADSKDSDSVVKATTDASLCRGGKDGNSPSATWQGPGKHSNNKNNAVHSCPLDSPRVETLVKKCVWGDETTEHSISMPPQGPQFALACSTAEPKFVPPILTYMHISELSGLPFYIAANELDLATTVMVLNASKHLGRIILSLARHVFGWGFEKARKQCIIFWESKKSSGKASNTIAYNDGGNLYFNAWFYKELKHGGKENDEVALGYWYVSFCHELAHNKVVKHDAQFASVFGNLVSRYLSLYRRLPLDVDVWHSKDDGHGCDKENDSCSKGCATPQRRVIRARRPPGTQ